MNDLQVANSPLAAALAQEEERKRLFKGKAYSPQSGKETRLKDGVAFNGVSAQESAGVTSFLGLLFGNKASSNQGIDGKPLEEALAILKDNITMAGDVLVEKMTDKSFNDYRAAVKQLTNFVVKKGFDINKHQAVRGRKSRRTIYTQVEVIDKKLNELAAQIFMNQRDKFAILAKTEEIAGLIVDMLF